MPKVRGGMPVVLPDLKWRWSPSYYRFRFTRVWLVVVHRPVGSYQSAIASMCDPKHEAAGHVIVRDDGKEATQLVPWNCAAWACKAFNRRSDNIETPDWIWTGELTAEKLYVLKVCARIVAFRLHKRKLPARWSTDKGFCRHYDLGQAGGGHTDPTTDKHRWLQFVELVRQEAERGGFRKTWGRDR